MKDVPRLRGGIAVRFVALIAGLLLVATGIVAMLESRLGLPPWDVLHQGIADHTPLTLGVVSILVGLAIVVVSWVSGAPPGIGTIANAVVIGAAIDVLLSLQAVDSLSETSLAGRVTLVAAGIALFGLGSALYIGAGLGAGPRDSLMIVLTRRTGRRIGLVRGVMEVTVLLAGLLLGGVAGVATLALALLVGPSVEASFWLLTRTRLAVPGTGRPPPIDPLDLA